MSHRFILTITGFAVALVCSVFVLFQLRPDLILADTTPAGGDMGAHVWGPAYLRDNLLSSGRLAGWTPDWYAGFPAYQFYMVVPALAIVAVNAGVTPWLALPAVVGIVFLARRAVLDRPRHRTLIVTLAAALCVVLVPVPYGISFKLVAVAGLVMFPIAAWWMGRLARAPEPVPAALALGAFVFLFDTNFTIYGGNIASTLAGEFAFSLSLCLAFVAIGWSLRAMDEGRNRASAAAVIALVALCHVIPLFFAVLCLGLLVFLGPTTSRLWILAAGVVTAALPIAFADRFEGLTNKAMGVASLLLLIGAAVALSPEVRARAQWLLVAGPVAALLSFFWLVPFYLREDYFNDMGWERLDAVGDAMLTTPMRIALPVAAIGALLSFATRDRLGMLFSATTVTFASAVANLGESKLWNARLLPFFYLSVYCLAAVALALVARYAAVAASERFDRPDLRVVWGSMAAGLALAIVAVGMPLRVLPGGSVTPDGDYEWLGLSSSDKSFVTSWAAWNFSGYEEKPSYREYSAVVETMAEVGQSNGCGRAMWEYDKGLDRYGTPMALMLLPHWTDGCIGSMEGLYFESSATTPFHFLNQSALSIAPSSAQRDLPYLGYDMDRGIDQLQVMGVRYYMAQSDQAIRDARNHPDLTELATSEPFTVFEVAGSDVIEGLAYEPVVASGPTEIAADLEVSRFEQGWLSQAVTFYNNPADFAARPAADGPESWERVTTLLPTDGSPLVPAAVSDVVIDTNRITFDVDQIGKPVVVKVSYFPNWHAAGADGPWRAGPNQMVVVPTSTTVELSYGYTSAEYLGYGLTLLGLLAFVWLVRNNAAAEGRAVSLASDQAEATSHTLSPSAEHNGDHADSARLEPAPDARLEPAPDAPAAWSDEPRPEPLPTAVDRSGGNVPGIDEND